MNRPVAEVIEEIGSWGIIAHELSKRGITGTPECTEKCPLANFIIGETDDKEVWKISVDGASVGVTSMAGEFTSYPLPRNAQNFIADFDEGEYRDLCDNPACFDYLDEAYWTDYEDDFDDEDEYEGDDDLVTTDPADVY